jgi:putative endonuclease
MFSFLPFGRKSEIQAAKFLRDQGFKLVASSFRVREGEVDLIAWEKEILVFVEVKSRRGPDPPEAAVGYTKQRRVIRAAKAYVNKYRLHEVTCRFDIVAVTQIVNQKPRYRLIRDAYRA